MQAGWVYILTNEAMPDLVKIGYTKNPPHQRAKELYGTGVALPFRVVYQVRCYRYQQIEAEVHRRLADKRLNNNREFFAVSVAQAVKTVRRCAGRNLIETGDFRNSPAPSAAGKTRKGKKPSSGRKRRILLITAALAAAALAALSYPALRRTVYGYRTAVIGRYDVNLRHCASTLCPVVAVLPAGQSLKIDRRRQKNGWIFAEFSGPLCRPAPAPCQTKTYAEVSGWLYAANLADGGMQTD